MQRSLEIMEQPHTAEMTKSIQALQAEIAERRRAEKEVRLLLSVTQAIAESQDFSSAVQITLQKVCENIGWDLAEAWVPLSDGTALELSPAWCDCGKGLQPFRTVSEHLTFARGVGLPGKVWTTKQPEWIPDISAAPDMYPRAQIAKTFGLKAALGVPILADDQVLAVLVFFMLESRPEDRRLVEMVWTVATQLGWVIQRKKAEEAARESGRRFDAIFNQTYEFVGLLKPDGTVLEANNTALEYRNLIRSDVVGRLAWETPWWDISSAAQDRLRAAVAEAAQGKFIRYEVDHRASDGTVGTFDFSLKPVLDEIGRVTFLIAEGRNITARKQIEEELRRARDDLEIRVRERTAELAQTNEVLVAEIEERERAAEQLVRRNRELLALHRISEVILHTRSLRKAFQEIVDEIGSGTRFPMVAIEFYDQERNMMVFKGTKGIPPDPEGNFLIEVPIEQTLSGIVARTGEPLVDTNAIERAEYTHETLRKLNCRTFVCLPLKVDDRVIGVLSLGNTESVPVEDEFLLEMTGLANYIASLIEHRRAEVRLQSLVETTQDAVISIDRDERIVLFNPAAERIFGYTRAEIQGQKAGILMDDSYGREDSGYLSGSTKSGDLTRTGEHVRTLTGRHKNGELFPIELSVTEIAKDAEVRHVAFVRDISEKKRLQDQLLESERLAAIGATAAKFAHEIGNPLNGMYMTAQLLERHFAREGESSDDTVMTAFETIISEIKRLSNLLDDFRSLYRRGKYNLEPISLETIATELLDLELADYAARAIRVQRSFPQDLPLVLGDPERLKQALLNLCKNAAEAMPHGGTMTIEAYKLKDHIVLEVSDTGMGIPAGLDIFEPFTTTKSSGTGLGLMIVRQIVAAHGGTLSYASEPGKGASFRVSLPLNSPF
ncbi:MAG: PAS domain S-box protein [Deltaproteobacteria bacterium]|nr:PAS domain S-box protein [Deltaproteobacteria bacterium]